MKKPAHLNPWRRRAAPRVVVDRARSPAHRDANGRFDPDPVGALTLDDLDPPDEGSDEDPDDALFRRGFLEVDLES